MYELIAYIFSTFSTVAPLVIYFEEALDNQGKPSEKAAILRLYFHIPAWTMTVTKNTVDQNNIKAWRLCHCHNIAEALQAIVQEVGGTWEYVLLTLVGYF